MSDDSFFREVSGELRQDRVKAIWTRFGSTILAAVVLVILVTAGFVGWERYTESQANASGDAYLTALKLSEDGKPDEAVTALQAIAADGYGAYPELARMSIGSVRAQQGQPKEAIAAFDAVANDTAVPQPIRDMAAIRAAYILVDSGTLAEVQDRVQRLIGDSEPMRFPAREAVGLAAWKAGDKETARKAFQKLADDASTPQGIAGRARLMLDIIKSGDAAPGASVATDTGQSEKPAGGNAPAPAASGAPSSEPRADASTPSPGTGDVPRAAAGAKAAADGPQPDAVGMPTTDLGTASGAAAQSAPGISAPHKAAPALSLSVPSTGSANDTSAPAVPAATSSDPASRSAAPTSTPKTAPAGSAN